MTEIDPGHLAGQYRENVYHGLDVFIVQKEHQKIGLLTRGIVAELLTSKTFHPRGIKVRLETGEVGRVQNIPSMGWGEGEKNEE